jgi:riboflavin kinase / FMN adenylyltransferase
MKVVHGVDALDPSLGRVFVVVGVFDGLHRGHLYLLERLVAGARARGAQATVITFDHHPDEILTGAAPPLLCDPHERLERLATAGVDVAVVQTFDVNLRMTPFDAFVRRIIARTPIAGFLMTPESAFGHDRGGTPETVARLGRALDYDVVVVPPLPLEGRTVSSAGIRRAIQEGRLTDAEAQLGRAYAVVGDRAEATGSPVVLRFPMPVALPPRGRYAVHVAAVHDETFESTAEAPGAATIRDDGTVQVDGSPPPADRLRIAFD